MVPKANRMWQPGMTMRAALREALSTMWIVEGHPGIWRYVVGCKAGEFAGKGQVIAETNGTIVLFELDTPLMSVLMSAMG